jgi:hypothetical protein
MRYFVKSHFNGWSEVGFENYRRFIENIMERANGLQTEEKENHLKNVTVSFSKDELVGKTEEEIRLMIDQKIGKQERKSFFDYLMGKGG